jgi:hypothetical protein
VINNKYYKHFFFPSPSTPLSRFFPQLLFRKTFYLAAQIVLHYEFEFFLQFSLCFHHVLNIHEQSKSEGVRAMLACNIICFANSER